MTNKRIIGLDLAKSIAIILVILIHYTFYTGLYANTLLGNAVSVLACVGVPLFFCINGYLLFHKRFDVASHYHKTIRILAILLIWKAISLPIVSRLSENEIAWKSVPSYLLGGAYDQAPLGYFWFINALIAIYVIFPILRVAYDHDEINGTSILKKTSLTIGILVFTSYFLNEIWSILIYYTGHSMQSPFSAINDYNLFGNYAYALVYFLIGGYINDIVSSLKSRVGKGMASTTTMIIAFIVCWALLFLDQRYQAASKGVAFYVENGYQNILTLAMTTSLLIVFMNIRELPGFISKLTTIGGSNTLGVYYLHLMLILTAVHIVKYARLSTPTPLWLNIAIVVIVFVIGTLISEFARKIPLIGTLFTG